MSHAQKAVTEDNIKEVLADHQADAAVPVNPILPFALAPNSGLYSYSPFVLAPSGPVAPVQVVEDDDTEGNAAAAIPTFPIALPFVFEELRLDADGTFPQMKASGRISASTVAPLHWVANIVKTATNTYGGAIFYKEGNGNWLADYKRGRVVQDSDDRSHGRNDPSNAFACCLDNAEECRSGVGPTVIL